MAKPDLILGLTQFCGSGPQGLHKIRTGQVGLKWIKIRVQPRILFIKPDFWARSNSDRVEPKIYNLFVRSTFWDLFENFLKIANFSYLSKLGVVFRIWAVMNFFDMFVQWIFQSKLMVRAQLTLKWHFDTIFKLISYKLFQVSNFGLSKFSNNFFETQTSDCKY